MLHTIIRVPHPKSDVNSRPLVECSHSLDTSILETLLDNNPDDNLNDHVDDMEIDIEYKDQPSDGLFNSSDSNVDGPDRTMVPNSGNAIESSMAPDNDTPASETSLDYADTSAHTNDWISSRLSRTLLYIRLGNTWDNIITIELGATRTLSHFLDTISQRFQIQGIGRLSILLPGKIVKLDEYAYHIESNNQKSFENVLGILERGIVKIGVTGKMR